MDFSFQLGLVLRVPYDHVENPNTGCICFKKRFRGNVLSFDKVSSRLIPRAQLGVLWKFICRTVALELLAHKAFRDQFITLSDTDNKFFAYYSWFRRI